ncbi:MAG TPA: hypothetical protein VF524_00610 [Polyangia bacterium]
MLPRIDVSYDTGHRDWRGLAQARISDAQIKADGLTLKQQAALAVQICKGFGRWSSVCSAIVCWGLIAAE